MRGLKKGTKLNLSAERREELRTAAILRFTGKNNKNWKGDSVGYRSLHNWVENRLGKPRECKNCNKNNLRHRQYHWANKSGEYKRDVNDWIRLCVKCHVLRDRLQ